MRTTCLGVHRCGWIEDRFRIAPGDHPLSIRMSSVAHCVGFVLAGRRIVRAITPYADDEWAEDAGAVHVVPADGLQRTLVMRSVTGCEVAWFLIPCHTPCCLCPTVTGGDRSSCDRELRSCLMDLTRESGGVASAACDRDAAAARLLGRLRDLAGGLSEVASRPRGVFGPPTVRRLVAAIDDNLRAGVRTSEAAALQGLSASQFAKKLRATVGLSLHQLVTIRRVAAAIKAIRDESTPLAHVALEVGFSSQSHLTRAFHDTIGITPGKYPRRKKPGVEREALGMGHRVDEPARRPTRPAGITVAAVSGRCPTSGMR